MIQEAGADIVGVQETRSPDGVNAERLAELLGWNHYVDRGNRVIVTHYEIVEEKKDGIKVKLPSGRGAYVFNCISPLLLRPIALRAVEMDIVNVDALGFA